jgi:hypothetical protein
MGVLLGVAALLSPSLLPAAMIMCVAEWATQPGRKKQVFSGALVMFVISAAILTPWIIRNYYAFGGVIPVRSNFGLELAIGNNPLATGKTFVTYSDDPNSPAYNMHPNSSHKERERMTQLGELAYMREKQHMAVQWMKENPKKAIQLTLARFRLFWFPPADEWARTSSFRFVKSAIFSLIGVLMFIELILLLFYQHKRRWLLIGAVIGPSLIYLITHVDPRYHYPVFGLSALMACHLLYSVYRFVGDLAKARTVTNTA